MAVDENFIDTVDTVDEIPPSAPETAPKKVIGRPITKETARQYQLSAAQAKARRKKARADMLNALTTQLNLGQELVKALKTGDESRIRCIEKAVQMVGVHYDQSEEGKSQNFNVNQNVAVKKAAQIKVVFTESKPPMEEVKPED